MRRLGRKWRPPLALVLGGALAGTLGLSLAGLFALRLLEPQIGFGAAAVLIAGATLAATLGLAALLVRLLLGPISALGARAAALRTDPRTRVTPLRQYGTRELRDLGLVVLDMADTLQRRETAVRSFADHATHELKGPVAAVRAAAELLGEEPGLTPAAHRLASEIEGAAVELDAGLAALRRIVAAREPVHRGTTTLAALGAAHEGLEITVVGPTTALPLSREGLEIVLSQLLSNAAAHGSTRVTLTAAEGSTGATLSVADDGPGIAPGNRDKIFDPFFTTRRGTGGTGLGLTITSNLLEAHGAEIRLDDASPGARFVIQFPPAP
ncbi:MAG: HAMP domain-containing sensor histidine kinase [Pseudomonadota bacterium]